MTFDVDDMYLDTSTLSIDVKFECQSFLSQDKNVLFLAMHELHGVNSARGQQQTCT